MANADQVEYNFRLAIAGTKSESITISWSTNSSYSQSPTVKYGLNGDELTMVAVGEVMHYYDTFHYHVTLGALKPSTLYSYIAGDGDSFSSVQYFTSPPSLALPPQPLNIALFGDMAITNAQATIDRLNQRNKDGKIDLFVHIGDIAYGDDEGLQFGQNSYYEPTYDHFLTNVGEFSKSKPYMICAGNHDVTCHSLTDLGCQAQLKNFTAINSRFKMPSLESSGVLNMWYSYDFGPIHFISLNTEADYPGAPSTGLGQGKGGGFGNQVEWLKNDLEKAVAHREEIPWIIVIGHRPLYSSAKVDFPFDTNSKLIAAFEDLFINYQVDMYFAGHIHAYERSFAIKKGKKIEDNNATVYFVTGAAGNQEGHSSVSGEQPDFIAYRNYKLFRVKAPKIFFPSTPYSVHHFNQYNIYQDYGWGELTVKNSSHLEWNFFKSSDGSIADHIIYSKNEKNKYLSSEM